MNFLTPLFLPVRKVKPTIISGSGYTVDGSGYLQANPTLGSELAVNGGFDSDTVWTKGSGWTITGGKAVGTAATGVLTQSIVSASGLYRLSFDISTYTSGGVRVNNGGAQGYPLSSVGSHDSSTIGAGSTLAGLGVNTNFTGTVDNISVKQIFTADFKVKRSNPNSVKVSLDTLKVNHNIIFYFFSDPVFDFNCIRVRVTFGASSMFTLQLRKYVNGSSTSLSTTNLTFVDGAEIEILRRDSTTFALYYNGVQVGTDITISDLSIINGEYFGIVSSSEKWKIRSIKFNDIVMPFNV